MTHFITSPNSKKSSKLDAQNLTPTSVEAYGKVAVLYGGRSAERKISLESGQACLNALIRQGVDAHPVDPDENLAQKLKEDQFDRAFIMLHGREGEDGVIQAVCQMLNLPYTGSDVASSALTMDKARSKLVMQSLELPTPSFGLPQSIEDARYIVEKIGLPVSVKPVSEGSSLGVTCLKDLKGLDKAYQFAASYGSVLIEKWIEGTEYFVSILGEQVLPAVEVRSANEFYDYEAKYESSKTQYFCPPKLSADKLEELNRICLKAFNALGCNGWGRLDVVQDSQQNFWILEVNTIPGMTSHSLVPMAAQAVGMSFDDLVMAILATSLTESHSSVGKLAQI